MSVKALSDTISFVMTWYIKQKINYIDDKTQNKSSNHFVKLMTKHKVFLFM